MSPTGEGAVSLSLEKVHVGVGGGGAGWWEHAEKWAGAGGRPRPSVGGRPAARGTQSQSDAHFWPLLAAALLPLVC